MSRTAYTQSSLFRRAVREQSSVSYTPGPNPDLRRFVDEHATPYDPAGDEYNLPPFDKPIRIDNRRDPINDLHIYWSKKPYVAIQQYISYYTNPGDLVLDPFAGSGGTLTAALLEGRHAIAIDISPAATFITKNYSTLISSEQVMVAFQQLRILVGDEIDWLYETRCDRCDGRATTASSVHSRVFQCPRCLEKVPLFDCVEVQSQTAKGKPKTISVCPHCYARGQVEEISTRSERFDVIPVLVSYECLEGCKPKRAERRHNDPDPKKRAYFECYDLGKLSEIESKPIPYWVPPHRMMNVESDTEPWGDKWRAGTSNFRTVAELFTKRNLWALSTILAGINKLPHPQDSMLFAFSGALFNATKMYKHREKGGGPQSGTYYLPQVFREIKAWTLIEQKVSNLIRASESLGNIQDTVSGCISTQSSTDLSSIPESTVDYIFTDPPYGGAIQYGELNFIWEAWLKLDTRWHDKEIVINETRGKSDFEWEKLLRQSMQECYRVLKPSRWLSLCYHDTSEGTWQLVQDLMTEIGFIPESSEMGLYIDTGQKSYNQLMAEKVTRRDLVINFRKPRPDEIPQQLMLLGDEDATTFSEKAHAILVQTLEAHPGSPADRLYDALVSRMVRQGTFERHNFDALLRSVAEEVGGRWYLLETAGQVDAAETAKEEAAAARLEAFMHRELAYQPAESGVHFSDLFEQALFVQDKPRRDLKEWLPEYFFRTENGTWRPPANEEERQQKSALRTGGTLRRIKRFGNALLEGVPPAERDRPENLATAADWIRQCRRAGLYELGRALYEKGGFNFAGLSDEAFLEVEEDYQICVRRS